MNKFSRKILHVKSVIHLVYFLQKRRAHHRDGCREIFGVCVCRRRVMLDKNIEYLTLIEPARKQNKKSAVFEYTRE